MKALSDDLGSQGETKSSCLFSGEEEEDVAAKTYKLISSLLQKSHAVHVNQLWLTVEGWQRVNPVSVDKVGVYFRHADPDVSAPPCVSPARVVIEVQQDGGARKLIIIRSALVINNRLDSPLELKLEATDDTGFCLPYLIALL